MANFEFDFDAACRAQNIHQWPPPSDKWWKTRKGALVSLLWDMEWHSQVECIRAAGHRFGGVIGLLRTEGFEIETRSHEATPESYEYRLVSQVKGDAKTTRKRLYLSHRATKLLAQGILPEEAVEVAKEVLKAE